MTQTASAVYENGVLRPTALLFDLKEGGASSSHVEILEELTPEETARREAEFIRRMDAEAMLEHFLLLDASLRLPTGNRLCSKESRFPRRSIKMRGEK